MSKVALCVMRLADMILTHPDMDTTHQCTRCGEAVGIYPSGQRILREVETVEIICQRCITEAETRTARPAPGALAEAVRRFRQRH
jgi:hypothetical protein